MIFATLANNHETAWDEIVSWVGRAMDLGLEGEVFPSTEELQVAVDSFHGSVQ